MLTAHTRIVAPGVTCVTWGLHDKPEPEPAAPCAAAELAQERMDLLVERERFERLVIREDAEWRRFLRRSSGKRSSDRT